MRGREGNTEQTRLSTEIFGLPAAVCFTVRAQTLHTTQAQREVRAWGPARRRRNEVPASRPGPVNNPRCIRIS